MNLLALILTAAVAILGTAAVVVPAGIHHTEWERRTRPRRAPYNGPIRLVFPHARLYSVDEDPLQLVAEAVSSDVTRSGRRGLPSVELSITFSEQPIPAPVPPRPVQPRPPALPLQPTPLRAAGVQIPAARIYVAAPGTALHHETEGWVDLGATITDAVLTVHHDDEPSDWGNLRTVIHETTYELDVTWDHDAISQILQGEPTE